MKGDEKRRRARILAEMDSRPVRDDLQVDEMLCQEIERLMDGIEVHSYSAVAGAYRTAVADYQRTGDKGMVEIAKEAEKRLRILLTKLRERKFSDLDWW